MTAFDKKLIMDLRVRGVGYKTIADVLGLSRDSIRGYCKRNNLDGDAELVGLNVEVQKYLGLICTCCAKKLTQPSKGRARKFCSAECRRKWWQENPDKRAKKENMIHQNTCPHCGQVFEVYGNKQQKFCSHNCYIKSRYWSEEDGI